MSNKFLKKANAESEFTPEMVVELQRCMADPIYFINNYVYIQHPARGKVLFKLYEYQERLIHTVHNNRWVIALISRQMGKCLCGHTVVNTVRRPSWFKMVVLYLVDREGHEHIKEMFEPPGTTKTLHLGNQHGSPTLRSLARLKTRLRGVVFDWCLSPKRMSVGEIYDTSSPMPKRIKGPDGKLKFIGEGRTDLLVEVPGGWSRVKRTLKTVKYQKWLLSLQNGMELECADDHLVITEAGEFQVKDLSPDDHVCTKEGWSSVVDVAQTRDFEHMYDLELDDEDHVFYTNGILSHNTQTISMYYLWLASFHEDKTILVASKSSSHATEIMDRVKYAYEELPHWLKPGIRVYNRQSVIFDNGSTIKSEATTEKTGRGLALSNFYWDETAYVAPRIQKAMWASLAPTLSTGGSCVASSTPNGDSEMFANFWRGAHAGANEFVPFFVHHTEHPERGPESGYSETMLKQLGPVLHGQEVLCHFISSDSLLIDALKLAQIMPRPPIHEENEFKFYEKIGVKKGNTFLLGMDPATGAQNDYTVIEVFEFPSLKQVAEFRSNVLIIPKVYAKLKWILGKLTEPDASGRRAEVFWSFERNGIGEAVGAMHFNDEKQNEFAELVNDHPEKLGMFTSSSSKVQSAIQLKTLVEKAKGGFDIASEHLLFELKNYVSKGKGYEAKAGSTDDAVSASLIVTRLLKHLANFDDRAREQVYDYDMVEGVQDDEPVPFSFM